jgi:predicted DNA-binding protein (MmcQ/YjbR family)
MDETALRKLTADWPGVSADIKWEEHLAFCVGGKMFCIYNLAGPTAGYLSFKVGAERFLEFTDRPGLRPAPYLARAHWVQLTDPKALPKTELKALLRASYELIAAKLTRAQKQAHGISAAKRG